MSVNNVNNDYYNALSLYNNYQKQQAESSEENTKNSKTESSKNSSKNESSGAKNSPYTSNSLANLSSAISEAMKDLNLSPNDRVTFGTILKHKRMLESDFSDIVKAGLKEQGIDENVEFTLVSADNGKGIKVISDSPDKAKIEKFFTDNPELVKQFEKIQALESLDKNRKNMKLDTSAIRSRIQMEAMTAWFAPTMSNYGSGGASFFTGINASV